MAIKLTDIINSEIGMVPIGGIIPVAAHMTGAFTIPTTDTEIRSGWMLCAGGTIPAGQSLEGDTPILNDSRFIKGDTAVNSGNTGGNTTIDLEHGHSVTSNVSVSQQPAFNSREHYHGRGTLGISSDSHNHTIHRGSSTGTQITTIDVNSGSDTQSFSMGSGATYQSIITNTDSHGHGTSGSVGDTGSGNDGDGNLSCIRASDTLLTNNAVNSGNGLSATTDITPQYVSCVYIIRVK